jgi:hypothetical protein
VSVQIPAATTGGMELELEMEETGVAEGIEMEVRDSVKFETLPRLKVLRQLWFGMQALFRSG